MNILRFKWMLSYRSGVFSGLELYASHDKHHSHRLRHHFVCNFGHNLQAIGCILAFYIPNGLATIGDIAFWLFNCMQASTGELRLQTCIVIAFSSDFHASLSNYKVYRPLAKGMSVTSQASSRPCRCTVSCKMVICVIVNCTNLSDRDKGIRFYWLPIVTLHTKESKQKSGAN